MIPKERVRLLSDRPGAKGDDVLYWMQASQREACNHALEFAVERANGLGRMHNTMRMYWGKKILERHRDPAEVYRLALHLNNKYELDGRDPNGCAGVAWCFGKHDRPRPSQPGFGTVRSMKSSGLEHKYDMAASIDRVKRACAAAAPAARISSPGGQK